MGYIEEIEAYVPENEQEQNDRRLILQCIRQAPDMVLLRENELAHITSSGFIVNDAMDKALMAYHIIQDTWAWTGGHADGDANLLAVALREAGEETGIARVAPLSEGIASLDILTVPGHYKRGRYVSAHLHLSVAYLLRADDAQPIRVQPGENTQVAWLPLGEFSRKLFDETDHALYQKLIARALRLKGCLHAVAEHVEYQKPDQ